MELVAEENIYEKIYYGSRKVFLKVVPGELIEFHPEEWIQICTNENMMEIRSRFQPQKIEGVDLPVIVPEIPAFDFIQDEISISDNHHPDILRRPLIKCSETDPSQIVSGIASGVRSCLLKINNNWYRLKGCGNNDKGFILRKRIHPPSSSGTQSDWCDIRGCAFFNTTIRELYYTQVFSKMDSIVSANVSLGYMKYSDPEQLPCGPAIPTTCIVEKTIGDRRFGTHVLAGIELLLPYIIAEEFIDDAIFLNYFPSSRPEKSMNDLSKIVPTGPFISDYTLGTSQYGHDHESKGLYWPDIPRDTSSLANMAIENRTIPVIVPSRYPPQWTLEGPREMLPEWKIVWDKTVAKWQNILVKIHGNEHDTTQESQSPFLSRILNYLFSRCGYDCGTILSTMHSNRISWGTYQDSMCRIDLDEWHCNAHANNLVVIPPHLTHPTRALLSFLDVDMAYGEKEMIPRGSTNLTINNSEIFDHILWREYVNMMEVLAGNDSSTGVPNAALHVTEAYSSRLKAVQSTLYDTMILAFQEAYHRKLPRNSAAATTGDVTTTAVMDYNEDLHQGAYCLMELAIIIMCDYIA